MNIKTQAGVQHLIYLFPVDTLVNTEIKKTRAVIVFQVTSTLLSINAIGHTDRYDVYFTNYLIYNIW